MVNTISRIRKSKRIYDASIRIVECLYYLCLFFSFLSYFIFIFYFVFSFLDNISFFEREMNRISKFLSPISKNKLKVSYKMRPTFHFNPKALYFKLVQYYNKGQKIRVGFTLFLSWLMGKREVYFHHDTQR